MSAWVRGVLLNEHAPRTYKRTAPRHDPALVREVAKIGNNLNQLARAVNTAGLDPAAATVLLVQLQVIADQLEQLERREDSPPDPDSFSYRPMPRA
jgi:truncated hemoglobin YjbI